MRLLDIVGRSRLNRAPLICRSRAARMRLYRSHAAHVSARSWRALAHLGHGWPEVGRIRAVLVGIGHFVPKFRLNRPDVSQLWHNSAELGPS